MLPLNIDLFSLEIFAKLGLIIFTNSAIIQNAETFHFSFQTWNRPFAIRVMFDRGCWWVLMEFHKGCGHSCNVRSSVCNSAKDVLLLLACL
jgi:hypothetical protein